MLVGSVIFVAIGVWVVSSDDVPLVPLVAGIVGIPMFCAAGVFFFGRLVRRRPELVLSDAGLVHRQSGSLAWHEVAHARVFVQRPSASTKVRYVQIGLRDPQAYYARSSWWLRLMVKANNKLGYGDLNLAESMLGASAEEVIRAMRHHYPELVVVP